LKEKNPNVIFNDLLKEISERDKRDTERSVAPLRPADDAVVIDTTELTIEQAVEQVMAICNQRLGH